MQGKLGVPLQQLLGHQQAHHGFAVPQFAGHAKRRRFGKGHFGQAQKLIRISMGGMLTQARGQINGNFLGAEAGRGVDAG